VNFQRLACSSFLQRWKLKVEQVARGLAVASGRPGFEVARSVPLGSAELGSRLDRPRRGGAGGPGGRGGRHGGLGPSLLAVERTAVGGRWPGGCGVEPR
jgi:hypothetical protein